MWASAFVAAVFALHPLHVESVAWIAERKDVLSTFFGMLTLLLYAYYVDKPTVKRYLFVFFAFGIGLTAKQMLVTLPLILLLLDFWPLGRLRLKNQQGDDSMERPGSVSPRRCLLEKVPLLFLSALGSAAVYLVQHHTHVVKSVADFPLQWRLENALLTYVTYIAKMFRPVDLGVFYPHPQGTSAFWQIAGAALLLAAVTAVVLWKMRQRPYLAVGWFWYLVTLVPVIGIVQVFDQSMADRYTYVPSIGIFIMVAWTMKDFLAKWKYQNIALTLSATIVILLLSVCTHRQLKYWRESATLFRHTIEVTEDNYMAEACLGMSLLQQGDYEGSLTHYNNSLRIKPDYSTTRTNLAVVHIHLGSALEQEGDLRGASEHYKQSLDYYPKNYKLRIQLADLLKKLNKTR